MTLCYTRTIIYPNTFYRVSVKALIKNAEGAVLVLKENQDTWSLPGGGLDHGEKPEDGIKRELKEELGINDIEIGDIRHTLTFKLEPKQTWLMWIVYDVVIKSRDFTLGNGVTEIDFINPDELKFSKDIFEQLVYKVAKSS
jgi:ADP-ribose pyrophosphatase YjhB (NUDIX family)